jgi:hypothetical protein
MEYRLINETTKEEFICNKITDRDSFDYYYTINLPAEESYCVRFIREIPYLMTYDKGIEAKQYRIIATNNPSIDLVNQYDNIKKMVGKIQTYFEGLGVSEEFIAGYTKSQKTHPFSLDDIVEFNKWKLTLRVVKKEDYFLYILPHDETKSLTIEELLNYWNSTRIKTVYFK